MSEIFIDVYFYDDEGETVSDCIAEYEELDWEEIELTITNTINDTGDFPLDMVNKIEVYSEEAGEVIKTYEKENLLDLLESGLHKCNSIWR